ncbi:MAG TPA: hypothetical protein VGM88_16335 [Kofleriaceae bacterium]
MTPALVLRPAARAALFQARREFGSGFTDESLQVFDRVQALPRQFAIVYADIRRALIRRYRFAVFFRIDDARNEIVVLRVLPQRIDPTKWPK